MSRRLKITLPEAVAVQLDELAANTGEPAARLAGQMVRDGIAEAAASGQVQLPRTRPAHCRARSTPGGGIRPAGAVA